MSGNPSQCGVGRTADGGSARLMCRCAAGFSRARSEPANRTCTCAGESNGGTPDKVEYSAVPRHSCVPTECSATIRNPGIDEGQVKRSGECANVTLGASCSLSCDTQSGFVGQLDFTCGLDGQWHGNMVPQCQDALLIPPVVVGEPFRFTVSSQWSLWNDASAGLAVAFASTEYGSATNATTPAMCFAADAVWNASTKELSVDVKLNELSAAMGEECRALMRNKYSAGLPTWVGVAAKGGGGGGGGHASGGGGTGVGLISGDVAGAGNQGVYVPDETAMPLTVFYTLFDEVRFSGRGVSSTATQDGSALAAQVEQVHGFGAVPTRIQYQLHAKSSLPGNVTLDKRSGLLAGVPTTNGTFSVLVEAIDELSASKFAETLKADLVVSPKMRSNFKYFATEGKPFFGPEPAVTGGAGAKTFKSTGALPGWLKLSPDTGRLTGTPSQTGVTSVEVQVRDRNGAVIRMPLVAIEVFRPLVVTWTITALPNATSATAYPAVFAAANATSNHGARKDLVYSMEGAPRGLVMSPSGVIQGTPSQPGEFEVRVSARLKDDVGGVATVNGDVFPLVVHDCDSRTCANGGRCMDADLFDGAFLCDCNGTGYTLGNTSLRCDTLELVVRGGGGGGEGAPDGATSTDKESLGMAIGIIVGAVVLFLAVGAVLARKYVRRKTEAAVEALTEFKPPQADEWELNPSHMQMGQELGGGQFGVVVRAVYCGPPFVSLAGKGKHAVATIRSKSYMEASRRATAYDLAGNGQGGDAAAEYHLAGQTRDVQLEGTELDHLAPLADQNRGPADLLKRQAMSTASVSSNATVWDFTEETSLDGADLTRRKGSATSVTSKDGYVTVVVAVKQCRGDECTAEEKRDFVAEAECMKPFDHPNVVRLFGVVTQTEPLMLVTELVPNGDVHGFLRDHREDGVRHGRLLMMSLEASQGLQYLADQAFVHRDFAARNLLLDEDMQVKVTDFGMSRKLNYSDYYRKDGKALMPVRWMAPECLADGERATGQPPCTTHRHAQAQPRKGAPRITPRASFFFYAVPVS